MAKNGHGKLCVDRKTIHLEQAVLKMTGKMSGQI